MNHVETINILWDTVDSAKVHLDFKGSETKYSLVDSAQGEWQCVSNVLKRVPLLLLDGQTSVAPCGVRLKVWKRVVLHSKTMNGQSFVGYEMTHQEKEMLISKANDKNHNPRKKRFFQNLEAEHQEQQNASKSIVALHQSIVIMNRKEKKTSTLLGKGKPKRNTLRIQREKL